MFVQPVAAPYLVVRAITKRFFGLFNHLAIEKYRQSRFLHEEITIFVQRLKGILSEQKKGRKNGWDKYSVP